MDMPDADGGFDGSHAAPDDGTDETRIGYHAHDVSRLRRTLFDQRMKPLGITRSQWWALIQLQRGQEEQDGEGLLQTDLARRLEVGKVTVGGLIDRLEAAGFVARKPDASDRRAKRISITPRGDEVLTRMRGMADDLNGQVLEGIAHEDVHVALVVLDRMKRNLRRMLDESR